MGGAMLSDKRKLAQPCGSRGLRLAPTRGLWTQIIVQGADFGHKEEHHIVAKGSQKKNCSLPQVLPALKPSK